MAAKKKRPARANEDLTARRARARKVLRLLEKAHPDARIYLDFDGPFQLLVATILSAQCTDERVNQVTPALFARYPGPAEMAAAEPQELEALIRSTGFFRQKARSLLACCRALVELHGGRVPAGVEALTALPGVGRKTANVVLANAFGRQAIAVDTHVGRVARRIGLASGKDPDGVEAELCQALPRRRWTRATHLLGTHGRRICAARRPRCEDCPVGLLCDYYAASAGA